MQNFLDLVGSLPDDCMATVLRMEYQNSKMEYQNSKMDY